MQDSKTTHIQFINIYDEKCIYPINEISMKRTTKQLDPDHKSLKFYLANEPVKMEEFFRVVELLNALGRIK